MYQFIILPHFKKQIKKYLKKQRSLKKDIILCLENFDKRNSVFLGNDLYKIRLKTDSLNKGKSKSFRIIILLIEIEKNIIPISIYFKGDQESLSQAEMNVHLEKCLAELKQT